jgi:hypothetical protein
MRNTIRLIGVATILLVGARHVAEAHFRLLEPASWLIEDERGDPQKAGPCGGTNADYGKPSYAIARVIGGAKLHIKVQETVYHPGHYRVALAVNSPTELPLDPKATTEPTPNGPRSVSAEIQDPVTPPVLARTVCSGTPERCNRRPETTSPQIINSSARCRSFSMEQPSTIRACSLFHHCAMLRLWLIQTDRRSARARNLREDP